MSRQVLLIGGACDGDYWRIGDELKPGDIFRVYKNEELGCVTDFDPRKPPEISITRKEIIYKLHSINIDRHTYVVYAAPEHWRSEDAMTSLFGQPIWCRNSSF